MMLVVADSSPLVVLVSIGHIGMLPRIFGQVLVPPEVIRELAQSNRVPSVRAFAESPPPWLMVRAPAHIEQMASLHNGELAAINLALELGAGLLLIDERAGRNVAEQRHIPFTGTIGVLELAADMGLLDLQEAFERVKQTDFWISHRLLDERLRRREFRR